MIFFLQPFIWMKYLFLLKTEKIPKKERWNPIISTLSAIKILLKGTQGIYSLIRKEKKKGTAKFIQKKNVELQMLRKVDCLEYTGLSKPCNTRDTDCAIRLNYKLICMKSHFWVMQWEGAGVRLELLWYEKVKVSLMRNRMIRVPYWINVRRFCFMIKFVSWFI